MPPAPVPGPDAALDPSSVDTSLPAAEDAGVPAETPGTTHRGRHRRASLLAGWSPSRRLLLGVVLVLLAGSIVLRFVTTSPLWLDEALTVDIARLPVHAIFGALRRDGAPPLFYLLLHFWMRLFGTSDVAVRALSGCFSVATLPLVWIAGRRLGGRAVGLATLVLVATSPFAVRYATETRMYALVMFLVAAGAVVLMRVLRHPGPVNLVLLALCTGALLYSHYWSLYLVATAVLWLGWRSWRGVPAGRGPARRALAAVIVGGLTFIPWLPTFVFQARHTGTPWAEPADFAAMVNAVTSFAGGANNQGRALALIYFALAGLGIFGLATGALTVELDFRTRPTARPVFLVLVATLASAVIGGLISGSAFQARYAAVVFVPLVLLVALGIASMGARRLRLGVLAAAAVFGLAGCYPDVVAPRTQAAQVAAVLARDGRPGDVVAYCPDQLGPDVNRLLPPGRYRQLTFPRGTSPAFVNWVDYGAALAASHPVDFAIHLEQLAGSTHQIWLVWMGGYQEYGTRCESIAITLEGSTHYQQATVVHALMHEQPGFEEMNLIRLVPVPAGS
jgi:mannosyltransferase